MAKKTKLPQALLSGLGLLMTFFLLHCGQGDSNEHVQLRFDSDDMAPSAVSGLLAVIAPSMEDPDIPEIVYSTSLQPLADLSLNTELDAKMKDAHLVLLAFDVALDEVEPEFVSPGLQAEEDLVQLTAVSVFKAQLKNDTSFSSLENDDSAWTLIQNFSAMIYVPETLIPQPLPTQTPTPTPTPTPEPEIIIDNTDLDHVSWVGTWSEGSTFNGAYPFPDGSYHYTYAENASSYFDWNAGILQGQYEVFISWQAHKDRPKEVLYRLLVDGVEESSFKAVQTEDGGKWNSFGTFDLDGESVIRLEAAISAGQGTCADAVRFLYIGPLSDPNGSDPPIISGGNSGDPNLDGNP